MHASLWNLRNNAWLNSLKPFGLFWLGFAIYFFLSGIPPPLKAGLE